MEENSKTEEVLEFEKGNVFKESYKQRDGFQKFWTKDKTEALLRILSAQAEVGEVHHGKVRSNSSNDRLSRIKSLQKFGRINLTKFQNAKQRSEASKMFIWSLVSLCYPVFSKASRR